MESPIDAYPLKVPFVDGNKLFRSVSASGQVPFIYRPKRT